MLESYRYDAFGAPTFIKPGGAVNTTMTTAINNRFLFTGREYQEKFGFYEYRARAYNPTIGRFMSEDPKGYDAGDYNLYRYCSNDPWDKTDPTGLFGRGLGWTQRLWEKFNRWQSNEASLDDSAKQAIDHALANGKDRASVATMKAFEQRFGTGSATVENMTRVSNNLSKMISALRDDGSGGYIANAVSSASMKAYSGAGGRGKGLTPSTVAWTDVTRRNGVIVGSGMIYINMYNGWTASQLSWAINHESGHAGALLDDEHVPGKGRAYAFKPFFHELSTQQALNNADSYIDFVHGL